MIALRRDERKKKKKKTLVAATPPPSHKNVCVPQMSLCPARSSASSILAMWHRGTTLAVCPRHCCCFFISGCVVKECCFVSFLE